MEGWFTTQVQSKQKRRWFSLSLSPSLVALCDSSASPSFNRFLVWLGSLPNKHGMTGKTHRKKLPSEQHRCSSLPFFFPLFFFNLLLKHRSVGRCACLTEFKGSSRSKPHYLNKQVGRCENPFSPPTPSTLLFSASSHHHHTLFSLSHKQKASL